MSGTIRTVLGIRGEPATPAEPALGLVWQAIVKQIDLPGSESEWMSAADSPRVNFHRHPWSIGGGGAAELKETIDEASDTKLEDNTTHIGITAVCGADEVFLFESESTARRINVEHLRQTVVGDTVREWTVNATEPALWCYDDDFRLMSLGKLPRSAQHLWRWRTSISARKRFGRSMVAQGYAWYEWQELYSAKLRTPRTIVFGEITTHNHFSLVEGRYIFTRTAPVIKLKPEANQSDHISLLGVLNSSTACFYLKQICHNKGSTVDEHGARQRTAPFEDFYAFNGTKLAEFPIPALVQTSTAMQAQTPAATLAAWSGPGSGDLRARLASARDAWAGQRRQLIAWQEELDWQIYGAFGLVAAGDGVSLPEGSVAIECPNGATSISPGLPSPRGYPGTLQKGEPTPTGLHQPDATGFNPVGVDVVGDDGPRVARSSQPWAERCSPVGAGEPPVAPETMEIPPLNLGERAFEIVLARKLAAGEVQTTWFARHGSTPLTALPRHWPAAYRELVERRIARIIGDPAIRLIEQPEYKRRWNTEPWDEAFARAAREWLLLRLETYFFGSERMTAKDKDEGKRMKDEGSDAAALLHPSSFNLHPSASRPALTTTNQLAGTAQTDAAFLAVAEALMGGPGFSVPKLVRELVELASVPNLPAQRYKPSGLLKRHDWEHVWDLQRREDAIDAAEKVDEPNLPDPERTRRKLAAATRKKAELGDIPVPPKYASADFKKSIWWSLRGKLDVPKERWILYPGTERTEDPSPVIAWAGWDPAQQARAVAEYYVDAKQTYGFPPAQLTLLLAGLLELQPWLNQWHSELDPNYGTSPAEAIRGFLDSECHTLGVTREDLERVRTGA